MKKFQNSLPSLTPPSRVTGGGGGGVPRAPPMPDPQGLQFQPGRRAPSGGRTPSLDPPCPSPSSRSQRKTWAALSPPPATSLRGRRPGLERASSRGDWPQRLPRRIAVPPPARHERFPGRNLLKALPGIRPTSSPTGSLPCPEERAPVLFPSRRWTPLLLPPHPDREPPRGHRTQIQVTNEASAPRVPEDPAAPSS